MKRAAVALGLIGLVGAAAIIWTHEAQHATPSAHFFSSQPPTSFLVEYQVVTNGVPSWEILSAKRPFSASLLSYAGTSPPGVDSAPQGGTLATYDGLYTADTAGTRKLSGRQPGLASGDVDLIDALPEAIERGLARDLGRSQTVAGRECHLLAFAEPVSGPLGTFKLGQGDDEVCVDSAGIVLTETWQYHGKTVLQRTARRVLSPLTTWPSDLPSPPSLSGAASAPPGSATVIPTSSPTSTFLAMPPVPSGFLSTGSPLVFQIPASQGSSQARSVVWAFRRGTRVISVEAGALQGGRVPWNDGDTVTRPVALGWGQSATTALRSDGPEVRVVVAGGTWVRIRGTVPLDDLVSYSQKLRLSTR
jgi:hypothetical protein